MKIQLYKYDGTPLFEVMVDASSSQSWSLMSDNKLSLSFELEECVVLTAGCYIEFDNTRFYLLTEYKPTMVCRSAWKYDLTLGDAASWLSITLALKTTDGENAPLFKYTGPAVEHAAIIVANLNRLMGTDKWKVGSVISTENITIDYSGKYCSEVLQEIVDIKNTEWWIDDMTLNIGRAEFGDPIELGYQNGLLGDIIREQSDNSKSYRYLYPVGSTRNIDPTKYGYDRLQLPDGRTYIDMNVEQGIAELFEEAAFAHIFPRYEGTVQTVRTQIANGNSGPFVIYYFSDSNIPFNPNDYEIAGLKKQISFLSGELMGEDFEVNYNPSSKEFEIITKYPESSNNMQLPGGLLIPNIGDKYVIWNITMPAEYYSLASQELLEAAEAFAQKYIYDGGIYHASLDYIDVQLRSLRLRPGQRVRLQSPEYFPKTGHYDSRITRVTRSLWYPNEMNIDISSERSMGVIKKLSSDVKSAQTKSNTLSATLSTLNAAFVAHKMLFDEFFEKDSAGNIHAKLSLWSSGGITAGGVGSGGSGGGGGESYNRLDSWADYSADKAGYVLSALLGKDLDNRVSALANAGYITASYLAPYALRAELPSLDGYATEAWVTSQGYLTGISSAMVVNALGYTPFNVANFTKANIKSTLGISDWALASAKPTYTASEVGALGVNDTATNANKLGGYLPTTYMRASGQYTDSLNDLTSLGIYRMSGTITDGPTGAGGYGNLMVVRSNSWDTLSQLYFNANNNRIFVRSGTNSTFTSKDWSTIAFTFDIPTNLSQFTDDVVKGKYLSTSGGTVNGSITATSFIGNLTGNADSASCLRSYFVTRPTSANQTLTGKGRLFKMLATSSMTDGKPDGDGHIIHSEWDITNGYDAQLFLPNNTFQGHHPQWRAHNGGSWGEWITIIDSGNYSDYALSTNGGTVNGETVLQHSNSLILTIKRTGAGASLIRYNGDEGLRGGIGFGADGVARIWDNTLSGNYPILTSDNFSQYALPLTGGVMAKNSYINWGNTDGFEDYSAYSNGFKILGYNAGSGDYRGGIHVGVRYGWQLTRNASSEVFQIRNYSPSSASWGDWKTLAFTDSNVASATKLQTPRTIWGQPFDGTGDISGNLSSNAWRIVTDNSTQGVFVQAKLVDGTSDAGRVFITGFNGANLSLFNVWSATTRIKGNVGIGIDYPSEALHVNGNGKFTGALTANSLTIGGATITYDSVNKALCINGNMYALGGITAGGTGISTYSSLEARVARLEQQLNIE